MFIFNIQERKPDAEAASPPEKAGTEKVKLCTPSKRYKSSSNMLAGIANIHTHSISKSDTAMTSRMTITKKIKWIYQQRLP